MEPGSTRRHLTSSEMLLAVGMLQGGRTQADVARAFNVHRSVICRLWQRQCASGSPREQHTHRSRSTSSAQDRYIVLQARRDPTLTARQLVASLSTTHSVTVSDQTIRNRLHESGLHSRRPLRCPALRRGNRARRVEWCELHQNWDSEQWSNVLFTDESRFGFHSDSRRTRVWRRSGNSERLRSVQEVHSYRGGTVMIWAGIMIGGRTSLVFPEGNLNAAGYVREILEPVVLPFAQEIGPEFILMQDNARVHTARTVQEWFHSNEINVLPWPAQSPDLNPIEHAWDRLQRSIQEHLSSVVSRSDLCDLLQEHWRLIPRDFIDNLILSIPRRCHAVLSARGGNTSY